MFLARVLAVLTGGFLVGSALTAVWTAPTVSTAGALALTALICGVSAFILFLIHLTSFEDGRSH